MRLALTLGLTVVSLSLATPAAASSATDLLHAARRHENAREDELAARRYTEALALDPALEEGWLGLGALRTRRGDLREAERVYSAALSRIPGFLEARRRHAVALRALDRIVEAEAEIEMVARVDPRELTKIAAWHTADGLFPAALAVWRRVLVAAEERHDTATVRQARAMVRALVVVTRPVDPAAYPNSANKTRTMLGRIAQLGGV